MNAPSRTTWTDIHTEVLRRLNTHEWKPGQLIPTEVDLAAEFGCARATVNRALQALADEGLLDRRRKAGTRVPLRPVRKASFSIPVLREDVEGRGQTYGYRLLQRERLAVSAAQAARMGLQAGALLDHVTSLHLASGAPFVFEDRLINPEAVPDIDQAPLDRISANEWLLMHAPYSHGDIAFTAEIATDEEIQVLDIPLKAAVFVIERVTWNNVLPVTAVRQVFAPGYRLQTVL